MAHIDITKENFDELVLRSPKKVLLDFWATWCGPCKMIAPVLEQVAEENPHIVVGKVNVDQEMELAVKFGIASIPTLLVFENGQVVAKGIGYMPKENILKLLEK